MRVYNLIAKVIFVLDYQGMVPGRLMVGHVVLVHGIGVRIPAGQPFKEALFYGAFLLHSKHKMLTLLCLKYY